MSGAVDDFLGLARMDLSGVRALVLVGASGSGKSTLLRHVLATHPGFGDEEPAVLDARPMRWEEARPLRERLVLVDEVLHPREVRHVYGLAARGCRVLVASHAPVWLFAGLRAFGPLRVLRTDRDPAKLGRLLDRRGISWDPAALRAFTRRYGATYTDLEIILERCPAPDLACALARFHRLHRITHTPRVVAARGARREPA